jgi:hypothetical protein
MSILIKGLGHENTCYILSIHFITVTFDQVSSRRFGKKCTNVHQNGHGLINWPYRLDRFDQIGHPDLTLRQIDHYDLALS